jgi:NAD(P)-dependent dehydrogenase (short-subunit alcohol dehydrogenase family)
MTTQSKVAVVTGAGSGIGRAVALALQGAGYDVAVAGRRLDKVAETAKLAAKGGGRMIPVACDVGDPKSVAALFAEVGRTFGRLDLLFNNAGSGAPPVPMEDITYEQWRTVLDANVTGAFLCSQQAIRMFKAQTPQGGRIINNGSISAHVPRPFSAPYTAAKHAMTGLTRSISLDGRNFNITCGQIDIGNAATDMTERMRTTGVLQANLTTNVEATMAVDNVSKAVLYMASLTPDANVLFMTVMANAMPFVGRG